VGRPSAQEAQDLLEDARPGRLREVVAHPHHRVVDVRRDPEVEPRSELDRTQDPDGVLAEADHRVADRVDRALADVVDAPAPVEHLTAIEVVEEGVHREVAAERVFVGLAEDVVAPDEEVVEDLARLLLRSLHRGVAPKGGDLDDLAAPEEDVREAKTPPDDPAVPEEGADVLGARARRDVEVLRLSPEEEVADATAHQVGLVAAALEAANDLGGVGIDAVVAEDDVVPYEAGAGVSLEDVAGTAPVGDRARGETIGRTALAPAFAGVNRVLDRIRREVGRRRQVIVGSCHKAGKPGAILARVRDWAHVQMAAGGGYKSTVTREGAWLQARGPFLW
jgi:hypothetical protein